MEYKIKMGKKEKYMNINKVGDDCCGCSACFLICPVNAISMVQKKDGFIYPKIDEEKCISCSKCVETCAVILDKKPNVNHKVYGALHKDENVWKESSSGGAFTAICQSYGDENTYVVGAIYDNIDGIIRHKIKKGVSNIGAFRGSKYIQSDLNTVYSDIKYLLQDNEKVIFSGTPCQVAGLNRYLGNIDTTNLLSINLFCHGVGSPRVFADYIKYLEKKGKARIKDYKFRDKKIKFGIHNLYRRTIVMENEKRVSDSCDLLTNAFLQQIIIRKSCFHCKFDIDSMEGDLAIGDFKKQYYVDSKVPYDKNESIIVSLTPKGQDVCLKLPEFMSIKELDEDAYDYPEHINILEDKRDLFFSKYSEFNSIQLMNDFVEKNSWIIKVWMLIPDKIRAKMKNRR